LILNGDGVGRDRFTGTSHHPASDSRTVTSMAPVRRGCSRLHFDGDAAAVPSLTRLSGLNSSVIPHAGRRRTSVNPTKQEFKYRGGEPPLHIDRLGKMHTDNQP
jgi:hypothetical protein